MERSRGLACSKAAPPGFNRVGAKAHGRSSGTQTWRKGAGALGGFAARWRLQRAQQASGGERGGRRCSTARHAVVGRQSAGGARRRDSSMEASSASLSRCARVLRAVRGEDQLVVGVRLPRVLRARHGHARVAVAARHELRVPVLACFSLNRDQNIYVTATSPVGITLRPVQCRVFARP